MSIPDFSLLAEQVVAGHHLSFAEALAVAEAPAEALPALLAAADRLRRHFRGEAVSLCGIINARSGGCDQDCSFCAQSVHYSTGAPVYPFVPPAKIAAAALYAKKVQAARFAIVTSGERPSDNELTQAVTGIRALAQSGLRPCASLGVLDQPAQSRLRAAGLLRYHHNLETSRSFYPRVCTTRSFDDNVAVLRCAKEAGLEVCSGCLFGLGETPAHRVELLLELRDLPVGSVPLNFLIPIPGTPLADRPRLMPDECLRIIALARFCLPDRELIVCGGRQENLGAKQDQIFHAGASAMMVGDLLTVKGRQPQEDLAMLTGLGLPVRRDD